MHNDPKIIAKIMAPVGKKVVFQYPTGEGMKTGVLKDRAVIPFNPGEPGVPYWDFVDLITFPNEPEQDWIRIGYYRYLTNGRLVWASQTTISEGISIWTRILYQAASEKPWFRNLLEGAVDELKEVKRS